MIPAEEDGKRRICKDENRAAGPACEADPPPAILLRRELKVHDNEACECNRGQRQQQHRAGHARRVRRLQVPQSLCV